VMQREVRRRLLSCKDIVLRFIVFFIFVCVTVPNLCSVILHFAVMNVCLFQTLAVDFLRGGFRHVQQGCPNRAPTKRGPQRLENVGQQCNIFWSGGGLCTPCCAI